MKSTSPACGALAPRIPWRIFTLAFVAVTALTTTAMEAGQTLFTTQVPAQLAQSDGTNYELGTQFRSSATGQITAIRFWKDANESGTHTGRIWSSTGTLLA